MSNFENSVPVASTKGRELWPIFICYRQVDGLPAARRLHELLDKRLVRTEGPEEIELDVYLDQTMPAVADWHELHQPYLQRARALLVVCSPGVKINEGPDDWVHREINWWLEHRTAAPILIDPLRQGARYVPSAISARWPDSQRIPLVELEWMHLTAAELQQKAEALRRQIVGVVLPSGAAIYRKELDDEKLRVEQLGEALRGRIRALRQSRAALAAVVLLLFFAGGVAGYAWIKRNEADLNQRISQASLHDAKAASAFDEARRYEAQWETARQRRLELRRAFDTAAAGRPDTVDLRRQNLTYEIKQLDETMKQLSSEAAAPRKRGYEELKLADGFWEKLKSDGCTWEATSRTAARPPDIFSIELINAGAGESILVHYGPPGATRLVMINAGPRAAFGNSILTRLQALKLGRFDGAPVPIELFVASDQDEHKTGGLSRLLQDHADAPRPSDRIADLRLVWANIFGAYGLRGQIRGMMEKLGIPQNKPFDHLVARPDRGQFKHTLPGGLEVFVLGPELQRLRDLYEMTRRGETNASEGTEVARTPLAPVLAAFPAEGFSQLVVSGDRQQLPPSRAVKNDGHCVPSENAKSNAAVAPVDRSIPNLASTILILRYGGKTFLHTGDARADFILEALMASQLMGVHGKSHVDLLHLPHLGSSNNLTPEFLERVTADQYLLSGDGTFMNPSVGTIAALIAARPCADYTMYFVNRDSRVTRRPMRPTDTIDQTATHAKLLDAFFAAEEQYNPKYRRIFRATDHGSVMIDLLDRVTD